MADKRFKGTKEQVKETKRRGSKNSIKFPEPLRHGVYGRDDYSCAYCGYHDDTKSGRGLTIDHIKSIEKGGAKLDTKNHITACLCCNSTKQEFSDKAFAALQAAKEPPKGGLPPPDMKAIREQARKPVDFKAGKVAAEKAKAIRDAVGGVTPQRILGKMAIREYHGQMKLGEKADGPGVEHGPDGRFVGGGSSDLKSWAKSRR